MRNTPEIEWIEKELQREQDITLKKESQLFEYFIRSIPQDHAVWNYLCINSKTIQYSELHAIFENENTWRMIAYQFPDLGKLKNNIYWEYLCAVEENKQAIATLLSFFAHDKANEEIWNSMLDGYYGIQCVRDVYTIYCHSENGDFEVNDLIQLNTSLAFKEHYLNNLIGTDGKYCHTISTMYAKEKPCTVVTGFVNSMGGDKILHSYVEKDNKCYDFNLGLSFSKEVFNSIYEPTNVVVTSSDEIRKCAINEEEVNYVVYKYAQKAVERENRPLIQPVKRLK